MNLLKRYKDAYLVARTLERAGAGIKIAGFVLAALVGIGGWYVGKEINAGLGFAGLVCGAMLALPFYVLGVLISAQGQILKATLDTAVNSSPLLTHDDLRAILLIDRESSDRVPLPAAQVSSVKRPSRPATTQLCPSCGALHPEGAIDCSCGHRFAAVGGTG